MNVKLSFFLCRGEVQALATSNARNENADPFKKARVGRKVDMKAILIRTNKFEVIYGEVAGGLGPFGIPAACRKKRFLDKVKLMTIMRDSINQLLKECKNVTDENRKEIIVYGWLQVGKFNMRRFQKFLAILLMGFIFRIRNKRLRYGLARKRCLQIWIDRSV